MRFLILIVTLLLSLEAQSSLSCKAFVEIQLSNGIKVPQKTLDHIFWGELSGNKLKSGMHSAKGLQKLLDQNPQVLDLEYLHPNHIVGEPLQWFAMHHDPSGVSYAKLPKEIVTRQGRKGLRAAHANNQGSYLWKSLFPKGFSEAHLLEALEGMVGDLEQVAVKPGDRVVNIHGDVLYKNQSFRMTVMLDVQTKTIVTAYPSGAQNGSLIGLDKSSLYPITRHMVTRHIPAYVLSLDEFWEAMNNSVLPHKFPTPQVKDTLEYYEAYFSSDYFGLPLSELSDGLNKNSYSFDPTLMGHYKETLSNMLSSQQIGLKDKVRFIKKTLFHIRNYGASFDSLIFELAIHNDIMNFVVHNLEGDDLADFHDFYVSSPSYWYSFFPTSIISNYIKEARYDDVPSVLALLKHPQMFLMSNSTLFKTKPYFESPKTLEILQAPKFIEHWVTAYKLKVSRLKLNSSRPDIDFVQDRLNHLYLIMASIASAKYKETLTTIGGVFDGDLFSNSITLELVNEFGALVAEFGITTPLDLKVEMGVSNNTVIIPYIDLVNVDGHLRISQERRIAYTIERVSSVYR